MTRPRAARPIGLLAIAMLLSCSRSTPRASSAVTVVADPAPFASLEEAARSERAVNWWDADPRDDDACTTAFAATELQRYLPRALGLPPAAVRLSAALPETGDVIVLGVARDPRVKALLPANGAALEPQAFRLRAIESRRPRTLVIEGGDRVGALYGAYALLERLGTWFPGLGDSGMVTAPTPAPWPRGLDSTERPAIGIRGFWAFEPRGNAPFFLWMARNRMNQWTAVDTADVPLMKKLGLHLTAGGHTIQADFLPPERYFAVHPEWYGLHSGVRSPNLKSESGDNFCTSNAEARRTLAKNLVSALSDGRLARADLVELWMLDGGRWCECDACRAQGSPTDRLLDVVDDVAAALRQARTDGTVKRSVALSTLAYLETLTPPSRAHRASAEVQVTFCPYFRCYAHALNDSSCTEINRRLAAVWKGWTTWAGSASSELGMCEYYDVGAFKTLPLIFPHVMAADLQHERRDTRLARFEYMHAPTRALGCWTLDHWLLARLTWNPEQDPDSLLDRFCRAYFPVAVDAMRDHYRALERASANILALQHCVGVYGTNAGGRLTQPGARLFPLQHLQGRETHPATNDGPDLDEIERAMVEARAALDRAHGLAREPLERARLAEETRRFGYGEAMFAFYAALIHVAERERTSDPAGARAALADASRAAAALRGITDLVQVSATHANAGNGLEASGVASTFATFARRYGR